MHRYNEQVQPSQQNYYGSSNPYFLPPQGMYGMMNPMQPQGYFNLEEHKKQVDRININNYYNQQICSCDDKTSRVHVINKLVKFTCFMQGFFLTYTCYYEPI